jgi:hypothetical protein
MKFTRLAANDWRGGPRLVVALLSLVLVAVGPAAYAASSGPHHHSRHYASAPERGHHRSTGRGQTTSPAASRHVTSKGATCVPGGDPKNPEKTFDTLSEYNGTLAQFDAIFRCLAKYPTVMPGWGAEAKGWTELAPEAGPGDLVLQKALMMGVWQGKVWYTHPNGGSIYNRMFDDRQTWHHRVAWTPTTLLDNKPAILVDASPIPATDNIRMVQPGIYLGLTAVDGVEPIFGPNSTWTVPPGVAYGYFTLDFRKTAITKSECPICSPHSQTGP